MKNTIAEGVKSGQIAYVEKKADNKYEPFNYSTELHDSNVEFSDDVYIITRETAEQYLAAKHVQDAFPPSEEPFVPTGMVRETPPSSTSASGTIHVIDNGTGTVNDTTNVSTDDTLYPCGTRYRMEWRNPSIEVDDFYSKVLSRFTLEKGLKLTLHVEIAPDGGLSKQRVDETRVALRELGLSDNLEIQ